MKNLKFLFIVAVMSLVYGCNKDKSIQEYFVAAQDNPEFFALDMPVSMLTNSDSLNAKQRETFESLKKINVLAMKASGNEDQMEAERLQLTDIFSNDKYQLLMKYGNNDHRLEFYFTGKEDAVEELIVFGYDKSRGLGVARVLGEKMKPGEIMNLIKSLDSDDMKLEELKRFGDMLEKETESQKDSIKTP